MPPETEIDPALRPESPRPSRTSVPSFSAWPKPVRVAPQERATAGSTPMNAIAGPAPGRPPASDTRLDPRAREAFVLDLFRQIAAFRVSYDASLLEKAARSATEALGAHRGDEVMAAAIMLDNELRGQSCHDFATLAPGSAERSAAEADFLDLLAALASGPERAAVGAANRLALTDVRSLAASAGKLLRLLGWLAPEPRSAQRRPKLPAPGPVVGLSYGQAQVC